MNKASDGNVEDGPVGYKGESTLDNGIVSGGLPVPPNTFPPYQRSTLGKIDDITVLGCAVAFVISLVGVVFSGVALGVDWFDAKVFTRGGVIPDGYEGHVWSVFKWAGISAGGLVGYIGLRIGADIFVYEPLVMHHFSPWNGLKRRIYGLCGDSYSAFTDGRGVRWCCFHRGHSGNHSDGQGAHWTTKYVGDAVVREPVSRPPTEAELAARRNKAVIEHIPDIRRAEDELDRIDQISTEIPPEVRAESIRAMIAEDAPAEAILDPLEERWLEPKDDESFHPPLRPAAEVVVLSTDPLVTADVAGLNSIRDRLGSLREGHRADATAADPCNCKSCCLQRLKDQVNYGTVQPVAAPVEVKPEPVVITVDAADNEFGAAEKPKFEGTNCNVAECWCNQPGATKGHAPEVVGYPVPEGNIIIDVIDPSLLAKPINEVDVVERLEQLAFGEPAPAVVPSPTPAAPAVPAASRDDDDEDDSDIDDEDDDEDYDDDDDEDEFDDEDDLDDDDDDDDEYGFEEDDEDDEDDDEEDDDDDDLDAEEDRLTPQPVRAYMTPEPVVPPAAPEAAVVDQIVLSEGDKIVTNPDASGPPVVVEVATAPVPEINLIIERHPDGIPVKKPDVGTGAMLADSLPTFDVPKVQFDGLAVEPVPGVPTFDKFKGRFQEAEPKSSGRLYGARFVSDPTQEPPTKEQLLDKYDPDGKARADAFVNRVLGEAEKETGLKPEPVVLSSTDRILSDRIDSQWAAVGEELKAADPVTPPVAPEPVKVHGDGTCDDPNCSCRPENFYKPDQPNPELEARQEAGRKAVNGVIDVLDRRIIEAVDQPLPAGVPDTFKRIDIPEDRQQYPVIDAAEKVNEIVVPVGEWVAIEPTLKPVMASQGIEPTLKPSYFGPITGKISPELAEMLKGGKISNAEEKVNEGKVLVHNESFLEPKFEDPAVFATNMMAVQTGAIELQPDGSARVVSEDEFNKTKAEVVERSINGDSLTVDELPPNATVVIPAADYNIVNDLPAEVVEATDLLPPWNTNTDGVQPQFDYERTETVTEDGKEKVSLKWSPSEVQPVPEKFEDFVPGTIYGTRGTGKTESILKGFPPSNTISPRVQITDKDLTFSNNEGTLLVIGDVEKLDPAALLDKLDGVRQTVEAQGAIIEAAQEAAVKAVEEGRTQVELAGGAVVVNVSTIDEPKAEPAAPPVEDRSWSMCDNPACWCHNDSKVDKTSKVKCGSKNCWCAQPHVPKVEISAEAAAVEKLPAPVTADEARGEAPGDFKPENEEPDPLDEKIRAAFKDYTAAVPPPEFKPEVIFGGDPAGTIIEKFKGDGDPIEIEAKVEKIDLTPLMRGDDVPTEASPAPAQEPTERYVEEHKVEGGVPVKHCENPKCWCQTHERMIRLVSRRGLACSTPTCYCHKPHDKVEVHDTTSYTDS